MISKSGAFENLDNNKNLKNLLSLDFRDSKGISKLPIIQLILPYKISCNRVSLGIPLQSLLDLTDPCV